MPELPVVRALAERLDARLAGAELVGYDPLHFAALKTYDPAPETVVGATVDSVGSRGKYVVFDFDLDAHGPRILLHLSQGGRVTFEEPAKRTKPKGGVVRFRFRTAAGDDFGVFVKEFGTERKAGWWVVGAGDEGPLGGLGPEWGTEAFAETILSSDDNRRVHTILRDQHTISGIGRGHADDALHRAQLSPTTQLAKLDADARRRLLEAIDACIGTALDKEREREAGLPPKLSEHFVVHGRWGDPCPVCGDELRRISYESHEITYCPTCQTGGKVLADRRLSRLLK